jgi:NADH-quinone oxidoreductase subunit K
VAFNRYLYPQNLQGHFFSLIIIAIAAAEAAVAIAIIINIYRNFRSIDVDNVDEMKF